MTKRPLILLTGDLSRAMSKIQFTKWKKYCAHNEGYRKTYKVGAPFPELRCTYCGALKK